MWCVLCYTFRIHALRPTYRTAGENWNTPAQLSIYRVFGFRLHSLSQLSHNHSQLARIADKRNLLYYYFIVSAAKSSAVAFFQQQSGSTDISWKIHSNSDSSGSNANIIQLLIINRFLFRPVLSLSNIREQGWVSSLSTPDEHYIVYYNVFIYIHILASWQFNTFLLSRIVDSHRCRLQ